MANLTAETSRVFYGPQGFIAPLPAKAATKIIRGSALSYDGGYLVNAVTTKAFAGFADSSADNLLGSSGDINAGVVTQGVVELEISGVAATDLGANVYASDGNTFTKTEGSNVFIGVIVGIAPSGKALVKFDAFVPVIHPE